MPASSGSTTKTTSASRSRRTTIRRPLIPYGGANTGLGGVIRDALGTGLGAKPICNTDVFCVASPDLAPEDVPAGVIHPKRVLKGIVAGVRDYGNRMGIPTVNGALAVDPGYLANPLVFCGTVGVLPRGKADKRVEPGDRIVAIGGRTGRDGIHGATFSSAELTHESESVSGGAVQIGNAITEKMVLDVIIQARDRGLFHAITDCGAGGFSSAVGEMGAELGASVDLEKAPLKYQGLSYTEIWISEAQERMVLAVPPEKWPALQELCDSEGVEATDLGEFVDSGRLTLRYHGEVVADLSMNFLHEGRPAVVREATWTPPEDRPVRLPAQRDFTADLLALLSHWDVCSKEWIIRQYDHEVQGRTAIKPLVGHRGRRTRRCGGDHAGARVDPGPGRRLRHQPPLRQDRPLSRWRRASSMRRFATAWPWAPIPSGSRFSTTSAGETPSGPRRWGHSCWRPRLAATWPWHTARRSSPARTVCTTNTRMKAEAWRYPLPS